MMKQRNDNADERLLSCFIDAFTPARIVRKGCKIFVQSLKSHLLNTGTIGMWIINSLKRSISQRIRKKFENADTLSATKLSFLLHDIGKSLARIELEINEKEELLEDHYVGHTRRGGKKVSEEKETIERIWGDIKDHYIKFVEIIVRNHHNYSTEDLLNIFYEIDNIWNVRASSEEEERIKTTMKGVAPVILYSLKQADNIDAILFSYLTTGKYEKEFYGPEYKLNPFNDFMIKFLNPNTVKLQMLGFPYKEYGCVELKYEYIIIHYDELIKCIKSIDDNKYELNRESLHVLADNVREHRVKVMIENGNV